ncbi:MAG: hypothetical protein IJF61_05930 [Clostridia bacterium]|nr:hypothetical protein [Clostridia bacterium]
MVKKVLKNLTLVCSVLLTVVLVCQIWFSSSFLPGGYDFLISGFKRHVIDPIVSLFNPGVANDFSQNFKTLYRPEKIVVNVFSQRGVFADGQEGFQEAYNTSNDIMGKLLSGELTVKSRETVDMDTYASLLKGKSLYVDYGKNCDYSLFSFNACGQAQTGFSEELSVVRDYVISLHDTIMNDVSIYVKDQKSGNVYRYIVELDKNSLDGKITELINLSPENSFLSYAFELNFHKEKADTVSKILFEPMVLMELNSTKLPAVSGRKLEDFDDNIDDEMMNTILRDFSINTRTMWRYTDLTDARVFVENDATLTLYPNGLLEYVAEDGGPGLDISKGEGGDDIYDAMNHAVDFVTTICGHLPENYFSHLRLQTDMVENTDSQGVYRICFDYLVDGVPVRHKTGDGYAHTIEIEIDNGRLKSYRQYLKFYEKSGEPEISCMAMMNAADLLVDALYKEGEPLWIQRIHLCYVENEAGTLVPQWNATINNQEHIIQE